jgi:hypothetical protein
MNEPDEGMNLIVFNAEEFLMNDDQMEVLRNSFRRHKLCQPAPFIIPPSK